MCHIPWFRIYDFIFCSKTSFRVFQQDNFSPLLSIKVFCSFDYIICIHNFPLKYRTWQPLRPTFLITPTTSQSSVSALLNHSASHTNYSAPCKVLSRAPTAPALPPGNPALEYHVWLGKGPPTWQS